MAESAALAAPETIDAAVELRGVRRAFGPLLALDGIDLELRPGGRLAVVGPSGSGKSTLLALLAGLLEPDAGSVAVGGATDAAARLRRCALMPQRDLLLPWRSALDNACLGLENRGLRRRQARARAAPYFERFGLAGFEASRPHELSVGMRQRVAFLRTLLADKDVLLLDEPFASLDAISRSRMQDWLRDALVREPRTTLLVTHDVEEALVLCERVAILSARPGRIVRELDAGALDRRGARRELVASPAFVALRERALEALE